MLLWPPQPLSQEAPQLQTPLQSGNWRTNTCPTTEPSGGPCPRAVANLCSACSLSVSCQLLRTLIIIHASKDTEQKPTEEKSLSDKMGSMPTDGNMPTVYQSKRVVWTELLPYMWANVNKTTRWLHKYKANKRSGGGTDETNWEEKLT